MSQIIIPQDAIRNLASLKIQHVQTGKYLLSHTINYLNSNRQQVCCNNVRDQNEWWIIKADSEYIYHETYIRLTHLITQKNIHSHKIQSPVTKQQEVNCCGEKGLGDGNDYWQIILEKKGQFLRQGQVFRLKHVATGFQLHSHGIPLDKKSTFQEVTCFDGNDKNDYWQIKDTANFINNNSKVRIRHLATNKYLHSHQVNYCSSHSSKQQEVTCFDQRDDNDLWVIQFQQREQYLFSGSLIVLTHFKTQKNLHSHRIKSQSGQMEVSCFGERGVGDDNDIWMLILDSDYLRNGSIFRLIHQQTNNYLHSHSIKLEQGSKQQEVTGFYQGDDNDYWQIVEILN